MVLGILMFPSFLLLEYRSREELELMPQTKEEHIQDLEDSSDSDTDSSSDSSSDHCSVSSSRHSVKSDRHRRHSFSTHVPPPTVPSLQDHNKVHTLANCSFYLLVCSVFLSLVFSLLVAWHSGRTSVFGWQTFPVLHKSCS